GILAVGAVAKRSGAVGALRRLERGQLQIDEPVATHLPQFSKMQVAVLKSNDAGAGFDTVAAQRQVTIQDLMRHTSGIVYGGRGAAPGRKLYPASSSSAGSRLAGNEVVAKLGSP